MNESRSSPRHLDMIKSCVVTLLKKGDYLRSSVLFSFSLDFN